MGMKGKSEHKLRSPGMPSTGVIKNHSTTKSIHSRTTSTVRTRFCPCASHIYYVQAEMFPWASIQHTPKTNACPGALKIGGKGEKTSIQSGDILKKNNTFSAISPATAALPAAPAAGPPAAAAPFLLPGHIQWKESQHGAFPQRAEVGTANIELMLSPLRLRL